jgi:hypothetical protein
MHIQCLQVKDRVGTSEQGGELTKVGLSKTDQGRVIRASLSRPELNKAVASRMMR